MAAFAGDFDDLPDEEPSVPPLPLEDRLWRHPSELGNANPSFRLDPVAVRRRWLQTETTRGSAWTAGLVGALLATGLVVLGTHLASAITSRPEVAATNLSSNTTLPNPIGPAATGQGGAVLSPTLTRAVVEVGAAIAALDITKGTLTTRSLGLMVRPDGMLVVPASQVAGASAVLVTPSNNVEYVGEVVGSDVESGLAVVHINGASDLPTVGLAGDAPGVGAIALAVTSPAGGTYTAGTVRALDTTARIDGTRVVDSMSLDLVGADSPVGSALVDGRGQVVGILTAVGAKTAIATPSWLARSVANQLIAAGSVDHGWLGVTVTAPSSSPSVVTEGAKVIEVVPHSSGAEAGLLPGDIIVSLDGQRVTTVAFLLGHLYTAQPKTKVLIGVERAGTRITLLAALDDKSHG